MSAITQFKYNGFINTGAILSEMLAQVLLDQDWLEKIDAFCPVPIHWTRRLTRSFNQAKIISEKLSDITHIPQIDLLSRIRPTPKQVGLNPAQRAKNIQGAFRASSHWSLKNTCICLVDDVMTTGSTLYEAASTLKNAGANTIYAAILAKAEQTNM
jgi:ComF family protein